MAEPETWTIPAVFDETIKLALALGASSIKDLPGCWECEVDDQWWVAINGHDAPCKCSHGASVDPFTAYFEFNGWPCAMVAAWGGDILSGEAANEHALIAALAARRKPSERRRV